MDAVKPIQFLQEDLIKRKVISGPKQFRTKVVAQIKDIIRNTLFLAKDQ